MVCLTFDGEWAVELYRAHKVAEIESSSIRRCRFCGEKLVLVRTVMNEHTGQMIHMFECSCGERIWDD